MVIDFYHLCGQNYLEIISDDQYSNDNLFEDPHFRPSDDSIFLVSDSYLTTLHERRADIRWLRPKDILEDRQDPLFFKNGATFNEVVLPEGHDDLENDSFMHALAAITLAPTVLNFVCPKQSFTENYKGVFRFRFWRFGKWYEVVIDDRLPTLDGKLIFSRSMSTNEFWVPLMEKALAKLLTRYEAMDCTFEVSEALLDLSGGTVETVKLDCLTENSLRAKLNIYSKTGSLVTACISFGHADDYGLTDSLYVVLGEVENVRYEKDGVTSVVNLVRVLSTDRCEWTGAWSDNSQEMKSLSEDLKEKLGETSKIYGGFWMDLKDFMNRFKELRVLHVPPELSDKTTKWKVTEHFNKWQKGTTAMGSLIKNKKGFHKNPQYTIKVDDEGDLVIASLMAVGNRREETSWEGNNIGMDVFKLENGAKINSEFISETIPLHTSVHKKGVREVTLRMVLDPGRYIIIPSTYEPDVDLPFLLRFFSGFSSKTTLTNSMSVYTENLRKDYLILDPVMEQIIQNFFETHAGKDQLMDNGELDSFFATWTENEVIPTGISKTTSAAVAALYDEDNSGKLSKEEILAVGTLSFYCDLNFARKDSDESGSLDVCELREALCQAGLESSDIVLHQLISRYVGGDNKITFEKYFLMVSKLRYVIRKFEKLGGSYETPVLMSIEDLLRVCSKL